MPGTFAHFMVVEKALDAYRGERGNTDPIAVALQQHFSFALQGSIGPDYPFVAERLPLGLAAPGDWGARMHFENTGAVVDCGLRNLADLQGDEHRLCAAWLFGFASHVIADSIMHPVVNLAVQGIAQFTEGDHGLCEITQDSWVFNHLTGREIADCRYVDQLKDCSDPRDPERIHPTIRQFWTETLRDGHPSAAPAALTVIDPDRWHKAILTLLPWAANPTPFARHAGKIAGLQNRLYTRARDLDPYDVERYVTRLRLPDGKGGVREGSYLEAFRSVVDEVVRRWTGLADDLADLDGHEPLPNWDLDSGVEVPRWDLQAPNLGQLALWANDRSYMA